MNMSSKIEKFWKELAGVLPAIRPSSDLADQVPSSDPADMIGEQGGNRSIDLPTWNVESITGRNFRIRYQDSRGRESERTVICRRLEERAGVLYLMAWCAARSQLRMFRVERIAEMLDPETGEVFTPVEPFLQMFASEQYASPYRYGLPPRQFAALNAALNVLVFMACCDGEWHPLENDALEEFAAAWWMRAEISAPFDLAAIVAHSRRLSPDAEAMFVSLLQCAADPVLAPIIRRHIAKVIDADGRHHPAEVHWGGAIDEILRS